MSIPKYAGSSTLDSIVSTLNSGARCRSIPKSYSEFWVSFIKEFNKAELNSATKRTAAFNGVINTCSSIEGLKHKTEHSRIDHVLMNDKEEIVMAVEHENGLLNGVLQEELPKLLGSNAKNKIVVYYEPMQNLNVLSIATLQSVHYGICRIQERVAAHAGEDVDMMVVVGVPVLGVFKEEGFVYFNYYVTKDSIRHVDTSFVGFDFINRLSRVNTNPSGDIYNDASLFALMRGLKSLE